MRPADGSGPATSGEGAARPASIATAASSARPGSIAWCAAVAAALAGRPGRLLVVADFDGTLAEASRDPGAATIVPLARRALRRLAGVAATSPGRVTVAVLTGRTAADVAARVGVGGILYLGDHGLQRGTYPRGSRPGSINTTFRGGHDASFAPAEQLADRVPDLLGRPAWLFVERKGPSVAFHVRQAEDPLAARAAVQSAIEEAERGLPPHDLAALPGPPGGGSPAAGRGRQARGDGVAARGVAPVDRGGVR